MTLTLALTGDSVILRPGPAAQAPEALQLRDLVRSADVAVTNLELLPNDFRGHASPVAGDLCLAAEHGVIDELVDYGFQAFALAHNHSLDYGLAGVLAAFEALDTRAVEYAGVGLDLERASMPCFVDQAGACVALLACASSFQAGQQASLPTPGLPARPGLNPLRFRQTHCLPAAEIDALRAAEHALGLDRRSEYPVAMGLPCPVEDPAVQIFGLEFEPSDSPAVVTRCDHRDLERITRWVSRAKARADVVIMSVHSHEWGASLSDPPPFVQEMARAVIDDGADVVFGHGPHVLRGMEIHAGRPIFYSLGNFIFEYELLERIPAEMYESLGVPVTEPPARALTRLRFPEHPEYWQTVLPVVSFEDGSLSRVEVFPVSLGYGLPARHRGRPVLARHEESAEILGRFTAYSNELGTDVCVMRDGSVAVARI